MGPRALRGGACPACCSAGKPLGLGELLVAAGHGGERLHFIPHSLVVGFGFFLLLDICGAFSSLHCVSLPAEQHSSALPPGTAGAPGVTPLGNLGNSRAVLPTLPTASHRGPPATTSPLPRPSSSAAVLLFPLARTAGCDAFPLITVPKQALEAAWQGQCALHEG